LMKLTPGVTVHSLQLQLLTNSQYCNTKIGFLDTLDVTSS